MIIMIIGEATELTVYHQNIFNSSEQADGHYSDFILLIHTVAHANIISTTQ